MRLAIILLFFLTLQLLLPPLSPAEGIDDFETQIFISQDGTVRVEESIRYDFSGNIRHGIYREIPYRYTRDRHNYNIDIDVASVTDFSGSGYKYDVTRSGDYIRIRIVTLKGLSRESGITGLNISSEEPFFLKRKETYFTGT